MKKILGNYLSQPKSDFPLDCETLEYIKNNQHLAEMLGKIAGDKIILSGCEVSGNVRSSGYVFLKTADFPEGEVLSYEGGQNADVVTTLYLEKTSISVTANADPYPSAYTQRVLKEGLGAEQFNWQDFSSLSGKTNKELLAEIQSLQAQIASLQPAPIGSIMIWPSNNIPTGWHLCDGSSMNRTDYASLFSIIDVTFGSNDSSSFNLPDMRGLYVAGRGANGYNNLNQKGGANTVQLKVNEMPVHRHVYSTDERPESDKTYYGMDKVERSSYGSSGTGDGARLYTSYSGGGYGKDGNKNGEQADATAHENRPPFIVMNYIIKLS